MMATQKIGLQASAASTACWRFLLGATLILMIAAMPHLAAGQPALDGTSQEAVERLREEAEALQFNLREQETDLDRVKRQEGDVLNALDRTNQTLQRHQRQAAALKVEMEELEQKIASTQAAVQDLAQRIRILEAFLSRRLVALYKISRLGAMQLLLPADSVVGALKRQAAIERILSYDEQSRQTMAAHYAGLQELQAQLMSHQEAKRLRVAEYERQTAAVYRERSHREALLARIRSQQEIQRSTIESLKEAARELEREIQSLSRRFEGEVLRTPASSKPLASMKGLLIFPVKGKILNSYGPYRYPRLNIQAFRNGIDIAAERGEPVRAVYAGTVLYASWFRAYGNIVVIDHGDHYYTVYAHLEDVFKSVDHKVEAGDVIATVGDSGAMGATGLYFELRHHDRPLDPIDWLNRG
jgi:septal ring factor EnvC (AmiA/AmiB activator)